MLPWIVVDGSLADQRVEAAIPETAVVVLQLRPDESLQIGPCLLELPAQQRMHLTLLVRRRKVGRSDAVGQVPKLAGMLPPGMPGAEPMLYVLRAEVANWTHLR